MLTLYRRHGYWWVRGTANRTRIRKSLRTRSRRIAEAVLEQLEKKAHGLTTGNVFWPQVVDELLATPTLKPSTQKKYGFVLGRFGRFLREHGRRLVSEVTPALISSYMVERRKDIHPTRNIPVGDEGIKSDLRVLRRAFLFARDRHYIAESPVVFSGFNSRSRDTQPFTREEVAKMIAGGARGARRDLRAVLLMFLTTGLRISDVIGMEKSSVDLKGNRIIRRTKKRGKVVSLPLHAQLRLAICEHLKLLNPAQSRSPLLFPTGEGKPSTSLDASLRRLWHRCGIMGAHAHRFRDTFAVRLIEAGASLFDVAKLLGVTVSVAECHYAPYCQDLRDRGKALVDRTEFL